LQSLAGETGDGLTYLGGVSAASTGADRRRRLRNGLKSATGRKNFPIDRKIERPDFNVRPLPLRDFRTYRCDVSVQAPTRNTTTFNNIIAAPELPFIGLAKGGFAKVTPIVASSPASRALVGGNLFRRCQPECFAMGVILLSSTLWRFGASPHTESTGNFGTRHAEMPYIQRSHFRRRDCTRILQYVGRRASRVGCHYAILGNPTRLALAFCVLNSL
jgi:hypothetical protein